MSVDVSPGGVFIALEGIDGSGKSTQGARLAAWLEERGRRVLVTAEPSDLEVGRLLRRALQRKTERHFGPDTVALLFAADRVEHVRHEIAPALQAGVHVIADRYLGSSLAFQPTDAEGAFETPWVATINRLARAPDLTLFFDVSVPVALSRIRARGQARERFEVEATLREVDRRYRALVAAPPPGLGRIVAVPADGSVDEVAAEVIAAVEPVLAVRGSPGHAADPARRT